MFALLWNSCFRNVFLHKPEKDWCSFDDVIGIQFHTQHYKWSNWTIQKNRHQLLRQNRKTLTNINEWLRPQSNNNIFLFWNACQKLKFFPKKIMVPINHNNIKNNVDIITWQVASAHQTCSHICKIPALTTFSSMRWKGTGTVSIT